MKYGEMGLKQKEAKATTKEQEKNFKTAKEKEIDYLNIIDSMKDETFSTCVDMLFPSFKYYVLKKEDIRRVDLKEQLVRFQNEYYEQNKNKSVGFLNYYLRILKKYYDNLINCADESRAAKCKGRGYEVMERAATKEGTLSDIEDSIILLLCLFRERKDKNQDEVIEDITISIGKEDFEMINALMEYKVQDSGAVMKKPGILDKILSSDDTNEYDAKVMYINSILFLCIGLQDRGLIG